MSAAPQHWSSGVVLGTIGMLGFSGTVVATRVAVFDFSPLTITSSRIVIAGILGALFLMVIRKLQLPDRRLVPSIIVMGTGLAIGFPLFVALAMETAPAAHGSVITGLSPAFTALFSVLRGGARPPLIFWFACLTGSGAVLHFAFDASGGHLSLADVWLLFALMSLGVAYVEGGRVSGELGGAVTLSWAMMFLTPAALIVLFWSARELDLQTVRRSSWSALAYLGIVSMFLASVCFYRGLAAGGVARIGQINLLMPIAGLFWAALFLGETVTATAIICSLVVLAAMVTCLRSRRG